MEKGRRVRGVRAFPPKLPKNRHYDVVGLGGNAADYIVTVPRHPLHGEKIRFTSFSVSSHLSGM